MTVCLALRNGASHLREQLDSIAAQGEADWRLIVSDDASADAGPEMVRDFAARHPGRVRLVPGPARGAAQNFLSLLRLAPPDLPLAFCDQDDVWLPHRLACGLDGLRGAGAEGAGGKAVIHCAATTVCDSSLRPLFHTPLPRRRLGLRHAVVQAGGPGNAMTLSPAAVRLLQRAAPAALAAGVPAHDWWAYLTVVAAGGRMLRTAERVLFYRQHDDNLSGRNDTLRGRLLRARQLLDGTYGGWIDANLAALEGVDGLITEPARMLTARLRDALRGPGPQAAQALLMARVYRQSRAGTAALLAAAYLGALNPGGA